MPQTALLANGDFSADLKGWGAKGTASVTNGKLQLGPGKASVQQRYDVPGLRILYFGANLKGEGTVRLRCFDARDRLLMDLRSGPDPKNGGAGIYTKTQARTAYVVLSIEKDGAGTLTADDAVLKDDDRDRVAHAPQVDLDAALKPVWTGNVVTDETVLLPSAGARRLLYPPTRILAVRDATGKVRYTGTKDFVQKGDTVAAVPGSAIPTMREEEFAKGEFPWTDLSGRAVTVSYAHGGRWEGPVPAPQGNRLPLTTGKLRRKLPVTIVAYGDSITLGNNVSGFRNVPPYLPPWPELALYGLKKRYGPKIALYNTALGGMTADWARENARDAVAALDPDLVVVAFGMNDFWAYDPAPYAANIRATLANIRARSPKTEFVLVAPMRFDPAYTADPTYVGHLTGYAEALRKMAGPGVAVMDMTALTEYIYGRKDPKSLLTDPLHPNDFLARLHAQALIATLAQP